jgi:REP element-mobilizing transposase RayT
VNRHSTSVGCAEQFVVSTLPQTSPSAVVRSVKGRLQCVVRSRSPKAFRRNYRIESLGFAKRDVIENYVASQLDHHRMPDAALQRQLYQYQIRQGDVDLGKVRYSAHGEYVYNLHLVFVHQGRWVEVEHDVLERTREMLLRASEKKSHRLSAAGIFPDHVHLALGCGVRESPQEVALGYLNNLAYVHGMRPVFQFGYYVGTFTNYDFGATQGRQA